MIVKRDLRTAVLLGLMGAAVCLGAPTAQARDRYREQRLQMVHDYIEQEGISNARVLTAMSHVPRHEFVPTRLRSQAYLDAALPIGYKQTISPPFIVAYMTETIDPQPTDRVLEIGTGSGYQAAVLSGLVKEVYTIEIVDPLGKEAAERLERLRYNNVHVKIGDGYQGWPEHAPFDKIIVTCSPEKVPQPLIDQLAEGGRMIIPLGRRYQQVFHLLEKTDGKLERKKLIPTLFVPMTGLSEEERTAKPDPAHPRVVNGGFEADDNHDGRPNGWHYQRQCRLENEKAPEGAVCIRFDNDEPDRPAQVLQGMGLDGREVHVLQVSFWMKCEDAAPGTQPYEKPALVLHFYDSNRQPISEGVVGPWLGTHDWQTFSSKIRVPRRCREAVLRIGLNGGTGRLWIDDVQLEPTQ